MVIHFGSLGLESQIEVVMVRERDVSISTKVRNSDVLVARAVAQQQCTIGPRWSCNSWIALHCGKRQALHFTVLECWRLPLACHSRPAGCC